MPTWRFLFKIIIYMVIYMVPIFKSSEQLTKTIPGWVRECGGSTQKWIISMCQKLKWQTDFCFLTPVVIWHKLLVNKDESNCHRPVACYDKQHLGLENFTEEPGHHLDRGLLGFSLRCLSSTAVISLLQLLVIQYIKINTDENRLPLQTMVKWVVKNHYHT